PDVADRVADVIASLSGRYEAADDLPLRFENDVVGNNLFSGLGMLMELEGRDVDITGRLRDRVRSGMEERYSWTGTMEKEVYRDGETVYVLQE
ncbi:MAG: hypothetical protein SVU88_01470, partial [Candidatus Nanohaloarchaea archaeon]|nr:hypothetical protein [Candidatus Nanohaloarchaea archaeon]